MKRRTVLAATIGLSPSLAAIIPTSAQVDPKAVDGNFPVEAFSAGFSVQTAGKVINITNGAEPVSTDKAFVFLNNENLSTCTVRARAYWIGTSEKSYVNNDVSLFETFNYVASDGENRSWAGSFCNAYNHIPEGITDSGARVGVIGWASSVYNTSEGYKHSGTLNQQVGVQGTAGFQGSGSASTAVVNEAVGVRGIVLSESDGSTIRNAIGGQFSTTAETGFVERNVAVQATAENGLQGNFSFYGVAGELYNRDQILAGGEVSQSSSSVAARKKGNAFEFGIPNLNGFGSNIGATVYSGYPFIAFFCEADGEDDTFTTRGEKGSVVLGDTSGALIFAQVPEQNLPHQSMIETARITPEGNLRLVNPPILVAKTPQNSQAPGTTGEMCWDGNFIYVCVAPNLWRRSPLERF